jgi:hypothetical protein
MRAGHPEMPLYRHWVDTMFAEVRRFHSESRWARMRDTYLLAYAHRLQTPMQELMNETLRKAGMKERQRGAPSATPRTP